MPTRAAVDTFTIEEAQARLPLVRSIVRDLKNLAQRMDQTRSRLEALKVRRGEKAAGDIYGQELQAVEAGLEDDAQRLESYVEELLELGIEPVDYSEGVVSFPSLMFGRSVCLSWKYDEPAIEYWHENDEEYHHRQAIGSRLGKSVEQNSVNRMEARFDESV